LSPEESIVLQNERIAALELSFTQLRLDLQTAGIIRNEDYVAPDQKPITRPVKSDKVKQLEKNDPF